MIDAKWSIILKAYLGCMRIIVALANRTILNSLPKDYLKDIEEERLRAQLIPTDRDLWELENYWDFIDERRKLLADAFNLYFSALGENSSKNERESQQ